MDKSPDRKSRASAHRISAILDEWDPIGVYKMEVDWPRGEYDLYVFGIMRLLDDTDSVAEVAAALRGLATQRMGVRTSPDGDVAAAKHLVDYWKQACVGAVRNPGMERSSDD